MKKSGSLLSSLWKHPRCRAGLGFAGLGILFLFLGGKGLLSDASNEFSRWVVYFGILFALAGTLLAAVTWRKNQATAALGAAAFAVRGRVGSVKKDWLSQGYALQYSFVDSMGRSFGGKAFMPQKEAFTWRDGDQGEVRYDPNDPRNSVWMVRGIEFAEDESTAKGFGTVTEVIEQDLDGTKQCLVRYLYRDHLGQMHEDEFIEGEGVPYKAGDTGEVEYDPRHFSLSMWLGKSDHATVSGDMVETVSAESAQSEARITVPASPPSAFKLFRRSKSLRSAGLTFLYFVITGFFLLMLAVFKENPSTGDQVGLTLYSLLVAGLFIILVRYLWAGIRETREWRRIACSGSAVEGTVTLVEQKRKRLGRWTWTPGWVVSYRYKGQGGKFHTGDSGYLSRKEAAKWRSRDKCMILCDSVQPEKNLWIGRT